MKTSILIFMLFVGFMLISSFGGIYINYIGSKQVLTEHINNHFEAVAKSRANQIETFLESKKERAIDFSSDGFIRDSLRELRNSSSEEIMEDLNEHLIKNKITIDESFYGVFVLDTEGKIVGTTNPEGEFGEDFKKDSLFIEGRKTAYVKEIFYDEEFETKGIIVSALIFEQEKFLGVVAIRINLDDLNEITTDRTGLGQTGEIYLINKEGYIVIPSRFFPEEHTFLKLKVDTERSEHCFEHGEEEHIPLIYFDYRGLVVLGVHANIEEMQWCLLAEIDEAEVLGGLRDELLRTVFITLIGIVVIMMVFIFLSGYLIEKLVKEVKKNRKR